MYVPSFEKPGVYFFAHVCRLVDLSVYRQFVSARGQEINLTYNQIWYDGNFGEKEEAYWFWGQQVKGQGHVDPK